MTEQEDFVSALAGTISDMPSRLIVVIWIGLFGFVQLSIASLLQAEFGGFREGVNIAYAGIGGLMPVYILWPFLDCGLNYLDDRKGKLLTALSGVGITLSMGWMFWRVTIA